MQRGFAQSVGNIDILASALDEELGEIFMAVLGCIMQKTGKFSEKQD